ncbi:hypothetical protein MPH_05424 [Macrophomina phaseolina MS6]|uniref:Uncharacterized protein n=1 Tax=Macrophomina phaseolina (strain MS6) TaxID=1126212 RepID=K2RRL3_MACPH|nr:hypothetical protein MPH_05424 [Macrophomina phaseolina MS6]
MNISTRHKHKTHCLTFGDVLIAARLRSVHLSTECMVSAREMHWRQVKHRRHRHCKKADLSKTGEESGHCQKCAKFNQVSHLSSHPTPARATKQKKNFLSHMWQTALTQMIPPGFCTSIAVGYAANVVLMYIYEGELRELGGTGFSPLAGNSLSHELLVMCLSNFPQFSFSVLYPLMIYNFTLINMEYEWGQDGEVRWPHLAALSSSASNSTSRTIPTCRRRCSSPSWGSASSHTG